MLNNSYLKKTKRVCMKKAKNFTDLMVWQKANQFVLTVLKSSESIMESETCGLTSQIRRAAVSIAVNIAEGFKKKYALDKIRFMNISHILSPKQSD